MKRFGRFMVAALLMVLVLAGCNPDSGNAVDGKGIINIVVDNVASRGLDSVDMDTAYYQVNVNNPDKNYKDSKTFMAYDKNLNMSVATGKTDVEVLALNKDKQVIGSGSASVDVPLNEIVKCDVTITEKSGKGNLIFEVETTYDCTMSAKVHSSKSTVPVIVSLDETNDVFKGRTSLDNGYYQFELVDVNGKTLTAPETVRIVAGYDLVYKITIDDRGMVSMTVKNMVTSTPSITFSGVAAYYIPGDSFNITAKVEGMTAPTYKWYFDGAFVNDSNYASVSGTLPLEGIPVGKHVITCVATEGDVIWSESFEAMLYSKSDRPRELQIPAGTLEIAMIGDVLIPDALHLDYMIDGSPVGYFESNHTNEFEYVEGGNLTCNISGVEGYSYHLETIADTDRTVILVVIEKNIVNPAFIHFTFNQKFKLPDGTSRGIYLRADHTVFPTGKNDDPSVGHLCLNNRIKERTVMVEPDSYRFSYHSGWGASNAFWGTMTPERIVLASGETVEVEIGSEPFATVNATVPGIDAGVEWMEFHYHDGSYIDDPERKSAENFQLFTSLGNGEKLIAFTHGGPFTYYETDILNLVEGENNVLFKKVEPSCIVNTNYDLNQGDNIYVYCTFEALIPRFFNIQVGVESTREFEIWNLQRPIEMTVQETGKLRVIPLFLDGYEVKVTERPEQIDGHRVFDIVVDLPTDKAVPVEIKYDFTYDQSKHYNSFPRVRLNGSYENLYIDIFNGKTTVNMPAGTYRGNMGGNIYNRMDEWTEMPYVKEDKFSVVSGQKNTITIGVTPRDMY